MSAILTFSCCRRLWLGLLSLILFTDAYALRDATFERRAGAESPVVAPRTLQATISCGEDECLEMPYPITAERITSDRYNLYHYSDHFRVVTSSLCEGNQAVERYAVSMLGIAETAYQKQVVEMGLRPPEGSDGYYIDIFLGRKSRTEDCRGTDYVAGSKVDWPTSYIDTFAGYAAEHPLDAGVSYLVMNAGLTDELLQVTLAHEIHHTIQFAYKHFENTYFSDSYLDADLWILEAMATAMESQVYPQVEDYVYYVNRWYESMDQPLDTFNGVHEYGAAIWILYLIDYIATEIVGEVLTLFSEQNGWQSILDQVAEMHGQTLPEIFSDFIAAVWSPEDHFTHGAEFDHELIPDQMQDLSPTQPLTLNRYGIHPVRFTEDTSLNMSEHVHAWNPPQTTNCGDWSGDSLLRRLCKPGQSLVLFSEQSRAKVEMPYRDLQLRQGWNLIGFTTQDQRSAAEVLTGTHLIREQSAWQAIQLGQQDTQINQLNPGWINAGEQTIRLLGEPKPTDFTLLEQGWNLVAIAEETVNSSATLEQFRSQIAEDSGYNLKRMLYQSASGSWKSWNYVRGVGHWSEMAEATAVWLYLE